jgi:hypothetical protein
MPGVSRPRLPWQGVEELLVDGNNLLHALAGSADPGALRLLLARLEASVPPSVRTTILLDGHPDPGSPSRVVARRGILVRHSGKVTADRAITDELARRAVVERGAIAIVTNDNELRAQVRRLGARAEPVSWLVHRLGSRPLDGRAVRHGPQGAPSVRAAEPPAVRRPAPSRRSGPAPAMPALSDIPDVPPAGESDDAERPPWSPGRGATRKRGNPRRPPGRRRTRPAG